MRIILEVLQVIIAIVVIISIMLSPGSSQLGMAFGGGTPYRSKRGLERVLFYVTVIGVIIFALVSVLIVASSSNGIH